MTEKAVNTKKGSNFATGFKSFMNFCRKNPTFTIGFVFMLVIAFIAVFAKQLAPNDPYLNTPKIMLMKPLIRSITWVPILWGVAFCPV